MSSFQVIDGLLTKDNFKHIFIIWFQGFDSMPEICRRCYYSWEQKNPDWTVHFIDDSNINKYIDLEKLAEFRKIKPIQCYGDAVRLELIHNYGGLYVDATIFCNMELDIWLNKCLVNDMFIQWDFDSKLPSINFLYSNKRENKYFDVNIDIVELDESYHKINNVFLTNLSFLKNQFCESQLKTFGKSSNNTKPKKGVKIISNSFRLMNEKTDKIFEDTLRRYPYFKLTYKSVPPGELTDIFHKKSKLIKLISQ